MKGKKKVVQSYSAVQQVQPGLHGEFQASLGYMRDVKSKQTNKKCNLSKHPACSPVRTA